MKLVILVILLIAGAVIFLGWDPMGLGLFAGLPGTWVVDEEAMEAEEGGNLLSGLMKLAGGSEQVKLILTDDGKYTIEGVPGNVGGEWTREGSEVRLSGLKAATYESGRLTVPLPLGTLIFRRE